MRQEFWKDIKAGDVIYMYGDSDLEIHKARVKTIKSKSKTTGSFLMDTDSQEHPTVFVFMDDFEKDGSVSTWNCDTSERVHISNNYAELVKHYKGTIKKEIDKQKALLKYYKCLLEKY